MLTKIFLAGLEAGGKIVMRNPVTGCCPTPQSSVGDVSQAFVADYRNPMLKKQASTTRLYVRQRREAKKMRIRKDAPGEWINRQMNSNAMRAALLASM